MSFAPPRLPLRGLELTGLRRHARRFLVAVVLVGAVLVLVGLGFGRVRLPVISDDSAGWGEWHSYAVRSWFIPILAAISVAGLALISWRGRPFTGVSLGLTALMAEILSIVAEPHEVLLAVDGLAELGYLGMAIMGFGGVALIVAEPILAAHERSELEAREPGLPVARVIR